MKSLILVLYVIERVIGQSVEQEIIDDIKTAYNAIQDIKIMAIICLAASSINLLLVMSYLAYKIYNKYKKYKKMIDSQTT